MTDERSSLTLGRSRGVAFSPELEASVMAAVIRAMPVPAIGVVVAATALAQQPILTGLAGGLCLAAHLGLGVAFYRYNDAHGRKFVGHDELWGFVAGLSSFAVAAGSGQGGLGWTLGLIHALALPAIFVNRSVPLWGLALVAATVGGVAVGGGGLGQLVVAGVATVAALWVTQRVIFKFATQYNKALQAENALNKTLAEAARRAEDANDAKGRFLAQMSHEIRTPLHGILGAQDLLSQTELNVEQRDLVRTTTDSGRALVDVIDAVLDLAKIESGGMQLEQVPANLHTLVRDACGGLKVLVEERGVEMRVVIDPEVPRWVLVDPTRLRQILLNLLANAVKFTVEGQVQVEVSMAADGIEIAVSDTGIGIPADRLDEIFEPFVQADASTTRRYGGTGLGLALVRDLVERMSGVIHVRSEVGAGSRFAVLLPLQTSSPPVFGASQVDTSDGMPSVRLLLVEDNAVNRVIGRRLLEAQGHEVHVAEHGEEALEMLAQVEPDAVLMDCDMPIMDGLEATRRIRQRADGWATVPVIALTASAMESDRKRCVAAGMDGVVTKPLKLAALVHALRANLDPGVFRRTG